MALRPVLGSFQLIFYSIGVIIGAGVYSVIGVAANLAGDALWLSFAIGAAIALLTALSYAEMTTAYPAAGAEYFYLKLAFPEARWISFTVGMVILFGGAATAAAVSLAFGGYLEQFFAIPPLVSAGFLLVACTALNTLGMRESSWANILLTLIEVSGLLLVIAVGLRQSNVLQPVYNIQFHPGLMAASAVIFFVYLGFEEVANISEEVHDPARAIPRAIFWSLGITTGLYVLVALSALALATPAELGSSPAPLATAISKVWPTGAVILSAIALFATANTVLITLIATTRLSFAMASEDDLPGFLSHLSSRNSSPWIAAIAALLMALILLPIGSIGVLAGLSSFAALLAFLAVNATLIILRFKHPAHHRPFRTPLSVLGVPVLPTTAILQIVVLMFYFEREVYIGGAIALAAAAGLFVARPIWRAGPPTRP